MFMHLFLKYWTPFLLLALYACNAPQPSEEKEGDGVVVVDSTAPIHRFGGEAMGTYYKVIYIGDTLPDIQGQIDSILEAYNQELSAWVPGSILNTFNASPDGVDLGGTLHWLPNLEIAQSVSAETAGAYDPTIAPLVRFWGFGNAAERTSADYDAVELAKLQEKVGMDRIQLEGMFLRKQPGTELDLNASAKGYGVDLIAAWLTAKGRPDHLVEIGGEFRSGGTKYGRDWRVAVRLPDEDRSRVAAAGTLPLTNGRAIATSGNYEDYYKVDGKTFSHTINPHTGLPERNRLLSASVLAPDCATADAYATACMVVGPEKALELVNRKPDLEGYFLVRGAKGGLQILKSSGL